MFAGKGFEQNYKPTEYYVESVLDYTSRYNNSRSLGYAPENLAGKEMRYPNYGDFPDTYILRSYGMWWNKSLSAQSDYRPQDRDEYGTEDYIVVKFEKGVIPKNVFIYETYNPGAVVRIWGRYSGGIWKILWEGPPQLCPQTCRKFDPPIRQVCNIVNEIRLDLNQSLLKYHTSLDAIVLVGYTPKSELQLKLLTNTFLDFCKPMQETKSAVENYDSNKIDLFALLPHEVMVHIFQYLDLKSLCRCAQVNKQWYQTSLDSILYHSLSLKKYWHKIEDYLLLNFFTVRCKGLRKLDLSWCGKDHKITEDVFVCFLRSCGKHLTHLSLGHCDFVKTKALEEIGKCSELVDLRLRNCQANMWDFSTLSLLHKLTALDLYSSSITDEALIVILRSNLNLKHLILDFCDNLDKLDLIAETVSQYNKDLVTWSSWKASSLSSFGVKHLANCHSLQELDFGWCLILSDPGDCLERIALGCKDLRRLIISRWRVTDNLLRPVIQYCKNLEQLDLLGIKNITGDVCEKALVYLKNLELLEVSFCDSIRNEQVALWREQFPKVTIQRSCEFVSGGQ